ncbi:serine hydrolase domain-containing protein [Georgenia sp. Z1344]|uniref:serine hydrolase domain-containing protein n=1 Tax=Georgenia sp. Z1344 TaxID=3416706 RepID=UPI003CF2B81A
MATRHDVRAAQVVEAMREHAGTGPAPGAVWAVASGPRTERRVTVAATGGLRENALVRTASVTKPAATALVLGLVEDGALALEDPLSRWVPAWAGREVLRERHGALEDTVPAARELTVRDLLTMGLGLGYDLDDAPGDALAEATQDAGVLSGWTGPALAPTEWAERVAGLPMAHQPGEGWLYQSSFDALTVVVEAATGRGFDDMLRDRLLLPLGMVETGYSVPSTRLDRVPPFRWVGGDGESSELAPAAAPALARRPLFCSGAAGLLSTAADLVRLGQMLLDGGLAPPAYLGPAPTGVPAAGAPPTGVPVADDGTAEDLTADGPTSVGSPRVLAVESVLAMRTDTLTDLTRPWASGFLEPGWGWGLGVGLDERGGFGWDGGTGTSLWAYPEQGVTGVLLTWRGMAGPARPAYMTDFWDAVLAEPWS